jgi:hypothetical protein
VKQTNPFNPAVSGLCLIKWFVGTWSSSWWAPPASALFGMGHRWHELLFPTTATGNNMVCTGCINILDSRLRESSRRLQVSPLGTIDEGNWLRSVVDCSCVGLLLMHGTVPFFSWVFPSSSSFFFDAWSLLFLLLAPWRSISFYRVVWVTSHA